jgi:hypothetical protein
MRLSRPLARVRLRHTNESDCAWRLAVSKFFFREREGVTPGGHDGVERLLTMAKSVNQVNRVDWAERIRRTVPASEQRVSDRWKLVRAVRYPAECLSKPKAEGQFFACVLISPVPSYTYLGYHCAQKRVRAQRKALRSFGWLPAELWGDSGEDLA